MYSSLPCARLLVGMDASPLAAGIPDYLRRIRREFAAEVRVIMTREAAEVVPPRAVEAAAGAPVLTGLEPGAQLRDGYQRLTSWAELFVVVPATAGLLGRVAGGSGGDLLSAAVLSSPQPAVFAPAVSDLKWRSDVVAREVRVLRAGGHYVIEPGSGVPPTAGPGVPPDTGGGDRVRMPSAKTVLLHLWHVQFRRLRQAYWEQATARAPRTPAAGGGLPLVPVAQVTRPGGADLPAPSPAGMTGHGPGRR
jgi:phosphopantothenoylcysteine decarboxylase/phosphopantothenate--cysteine ligase